MSWKQIYEARLTSAGEAIKVVKAGDSVAFAYGTEPLNLGTALLARGKDVGGVKIFLPAPSRHFPWYDPGLDNTFKIEISHVLPVVQEMMADKRGDFQVGSMLWAHEPGINNPADVLIVQLSTPDEHGYCSFGSTLWNKKQAVRDARIVLAEINKNIIRTYGDNFIHVSEIDFFVEHTPSGRKPGVTDMLGRKTEGPSEIIRKICKNVSSFIRDGDCIEIGVGGPAEWLPRLGVLNDRNDIGVHSENLPPGFVDLVRNGVITGLRKNIHKGKVVSTACGGSTKEDLDFINMNPIFELYGSDYVLDPRTISANNNVVAINSALMVDLTGQIGAESIGQRMVSSTGGQLAFTIGAALSKGGRCISVLPSSARGGSVSRIVPKMEPGTVVSIPRTLADIIVTEYGIARLKGKTQRGRAQELISIAHPDFRAELRKTAESTFYP